MPIICGMRNGPAVEADGKTLATLKADDDDASKLFFGGRAADGDSRPGTGVMIFFKYFRRKIWQIFWHFCLKLLLVSA
jgi:hypothetical protein